MGRFNRRPFFNKESMSKGHYIGTDLKYKLDITASGFDAAVDGYSADVYLDGVEVQNCRIVTNSAGESFLCIPTASLTPGVLTLKVTVRVPDDDFQGGIRKIVAKPITLDVLI